MRARSASSISAMRCLPERLMPRSSSSSGIDAVANDAAVARQRRRLVERACARAASRSVGEIVELRRPGCATSGACSSLEQQRDARHGGERLAQRRPGRAGRRCRATARATSRSMSWTAFSVSRSLARSVVRNANSSTASSRSWMRSSDSSGRSSQRAQQPAAHRRHRAIDLVQQRSGPAAVGAFDHLEVAQRRRIDRAGSRRRRGTRSRGRARDRPSACRAGTARARRRRATAAA